MKGLRNAASDLWYELTEPLVAGLQALFWYLGLIVSPSKGSVDPNRGPRWVVAFRRFLKKHNV